jgi:hypothetical protein
LLLLLLPLLLLPALLMAVLLLFTWLLLQAYTQSKITTRAATDTYVAEQQSSNVNVMLLQA